MSNTVYKIKCDIYRGNYLIVGFFKVWWIQTSNKSD